jgi:predicted nuclease of predicted toxin-antitoxin system
MPPRYSGNWAGSLHVGVLGMARAEIVTFARDNGATIVTLDADFHALLATSRGKTETGS